MSQRNRNKNTDPASMLQIIIVALFVIGASLVLFLMVYHFSAIDPSMPHSVYLLPRSWLPMLFGSFAGGIGFLFWFLHEYHADVRPGDQIETKHSTRGELAFFAGEFLKRSMAGGCVIAVLSPFPLANQISPFTFVLGFLAGVSSDIVIVLSKRLTETLTKKKPN